MFQPLGLKVVKGDIYVAGRDQITRLKDLNRDGEADFYENFNNDTVVTPKYHEFVLDLQREIPFYRERHNLKPGITGWAQVNGLRGETRTPELMERRVELDVWYLENWSFWLDLKIVVKTVTNMFGKDEKAY